MRFELRCFTILCGFTAAACAQGSSSAPLPPMGVANSASSREAVALPDAGAFKSLYPFGKNAYDGSQPTFLVPFNGVLYGTTTSGGVNGDGIVFSVTPGGKEKILHTFTFNDGAGPVGPLFNVNGLFFGTTTTGGGPGNLGEVFSIDVNGGFNVVRAFQGGSSDGSAPNAGLVGLGGKLFGTTSGGGANNLGTVYSITTAGAEHVIHSFAGPDGQEPLSTLIVARGDLYGTTLTGGKFEGGTLFRITAAGNFKVLHNFGKGTDANAPYLGALVDLNDTLYGTTLHGGTKGLGAIFESTLSGQEKVIYSFVGTSTKGCQPQAGLVLLNGTVYGTSVGGSTKPCLSKGTVFRVDGPGSVTTLHTFSGGNGGNSPIGLTSLNGNLYGTTLGGGLFNQGLFYSVTP